MAISTYKDNIDQCLVCGQEIPPGPDFCSEECEQKAEKLFPFAHLPEGSY
jgi:ribosomal protein L24E